jgi:GNAT superfamily N-acetyltransferase
VAGAARRRGGRAEGAGRPLNVRPAQPQDAEAIARVQVESWRGAYRGLLPDALLDGLSVVRRRDGWRLTLERPLPRSHVLVADDGGEVVGFASVGPSRDADCDPAAVGELYTLYLLPSRWGLGVGAALHDAALAALRAEGWQSAIVWVLDGNERGRSFYERHGWGLEGAERDEPRYRPARELRYRRPGYSNQTSVARMP